MLKRVVTDRYIILEDSKMAQQTIEIKMARFENSPWGFRLHGGADFSTPLTIQKVRKTFMQYHNCCFFLYPQC